MLIPTCIIKFFELMLAIACLSLHHYSYDLTDIPTLMLCSGTYIGFVVVLSGEIVGEMIFAPLDLVQDMYFGILGMGLFSVSGGLLLSSRLRDSLYPRTGDRTAAMLEGSLAITNAIIMLFDLSLAYLDSEEFDEEREAVSAAADAYIDAWWSASGGLLFGTCGALLLRWWRDIPASQRRHHAQATAVCSLATAALLIIDALLAVCSAHKDDASMRTKTKKQGNTCS